MRSEPAHLGGILLDFAGIPPWWDENLDVVLWILLARSIVLGVIKKRCHRKNSVFLDPFFPFVIIF